MISHINWTERAAAIKTASTGVPELSEWQLRIFAAKWWEHHMPRVRAVAEAWRDQVEP